MLFSFTLSISYLQFLSGSFARALGRLEARQVSTARPRWFSRPKNRSRGQKTVREASGVRLCVPSPPGESGDTWASANPRTPRGRAGSPYGRRPSGAAMAIRGRLSAHTRFAKFRVRLAGKPTEAGIPTRAEEPTRNASPRATNEPRVGSVMRPPNLRLPVGLVPRVWTRLRELDLERSSQGG